MVIRHCCAESVHPECPVIRAAHANPAFSRPWDHPNPFREAIRNRRAAEIACSIHPSTLARQRL
jgi:hypothetical protein